MRSAKCKEKALFFVFALCTLHFALLAAEPPTEQILRAALQSNGAWDVLEHLSDNIGPRLSGSKQAAAAVEWTTSTFRSWGIETRNEPVLVPHWVRGVETGRLVSHMDQRIVLTALGMSVATPDEGITAEVVEVSSFEELAAIGDGARGRVVLFNKALDATLVGQGRSFEAYSQVAPLRGTGASRAAEKGAVAMLIRSIGSASLRTPHTGALRYDVKAPRIPAAAVTTEDADLIHRLLAKGETVRIELILTPRELPEAQSANVVAEIRGSEKPDEIVLLGGHLDSWDLGTGAIDDGSGVAMVMETMRILKASGLRPRRTIRAVLFMNEENGLRGGKAYFEAHQNERHVAAIETDGGATLPCGFVTTLGADSIARLRPSLARLERLGAWYLQSQAHTGADTSYLVDAGVPGFGLLTDSRHYFDYHHTPADTLDKVDPRELQQDTAVLVTLAWELAQGK